MITTNTLQTPQQIVLPASLINLISRLPAWPAAHAFVTGFNLTVWKKLRELDWDGLYGKIFCVVIKDFKLSLYFSVTPKGLRAEKTGQADVVFTATLLDLVRLALRLEDPDALFFNRRLLIEGNTDIGLRVKNMLDGIEFETLLDSFPGVLGRAVMFVRNKL